MADPAAVWKARTLLRAARSATLATTGEGQPFAALVTPACAPDLSVLMLLSSLSHHTRQLLAHPRCAIMVVGEAPDLNPQTAPRLTVTGQALPINDPALRGRWVARHQYAAFYAALEDFRLFQLRPESGRFIAGFASAHRLQQSELTPDPAAVGAIAAAEPSIIAHMNAEHPDALAHLGGGPGWRMSALDVDGCDLTREHAVHRLAWSGPVSDPIAVRAELVRLSRA